MESLKKAILDMIQKIMSSPRKITSKLLEDLRTHRDPDESRRIRTSMIIAARIASALREKGWNKIRLASELNKSPSLVTRWLSGNHNFTTDTLSDIQNVLGIQLLHLEPVQGMVNPPRTNSASSLLFCDHPASAYSPSQTNPVS